MKNLYKINYSESDEKVFTMNSSNLLTTTEMISIRGGVEAPAPPPLLK